MPEARRRQFRGRLLMNDGTRGRFQAQPAKTESAANIQPATFDREVVLTRLYRDHYGELCARLRRLFGNGPPEPEDAAQMAFAKLSEISDLSHIQQPRAFLFRTAINLSLNAIDRIRVARRFAERELSATNAPIVEENTPEDVFSMRQRLERTQRAFTRLTDKQKEILIRSRIKGETYAEITRATGWSQTDISRQLKAALKTILDDIDQER